MTVDSPWVNLSYIFLYSLLWRLLHNFGKNEKNIEKRYLIDEAWSVLKNLFFDLYKKKSLKFKNGFKFIFFNEKTIQKKKRVTLEKSKRVRMWGKVQLLIKIFQLLSTAANIYMWQWKQQSNLPTAMIDHSSSEKSSFFSSLSARTRGSLEKCLQRGINEENYFYIHTI